MIQQVKSAGKSARGIWGRPSYIHIRISKKIGIREKWGRLGFYAFLISTRKNNPRNLLSSPYKGMAKGVKAKKVIISWNVPIFSCIVYLPVEDE